VHAHIRLPLDRLARSTDIITLAQVVVKEVRNLGGFNRVMLYRFDEGWNGEVIGEVVAEQGRAAHFISPPAFDCSQLVTENIIPWARSCSRMLRR
jgi:GAF domain-containing protein